MLYCAEMLQHVLTNVLSYVNVQQGLYRSSKMISTVTVTTITTISAITSVTAMGMAAALSIVATITLVSFLTTKEIVSVRTDGFSQRMGRFLNVGIAPLLMIFTATVATIVATML